MTSNKEIQIQLSNHDDCFAEFINIEFENDLFCLKLSSYEGVALLTKTEGIRLINELSQLMDVT